MNVLVVGAGAVGSVLSARLGAAGHSVTVLARPAAAGPIGRRGLVIEGVGAGTFPVAVVETPPTTVRFHAVILATKTFDLAAATRSVARALPAVPTLLVQNGLGVEELALGELRAAGWNHPEAFLVRAIQSIAATWVAPGVVRAIGPGEIVLPAPDLAGPATSAVRTFAELFAGTSVPVRASATFHREIWKKLLVNAAINPVTALHRVPNGAVLEPPLRSEATALLEEARQVAAREGEAFSPSEAVSEFERVARASATNRSSMLQDLERGRPTEIEAISGEIVRRAHASGVMVPATEAALAAVRAAARSAPQPL